MARRIGGQGLRRTGAHRPAGIGGARHRGRGDAQQQRRHPALLCGQRKATAGGQVEHFRIAVQFDHRHPHPGAAHDIGRGAQHRQRVRQQPQQQAGGIDADLDQSRCVQMPPSRTTAASRNHTMPPPSRTASMPAKPVALPASPMSSAKISCTRPRATPPSSAASISPCPVATRTTLPTGAHRSIAATRRFSADSTDDSTFMICSYRASVADSSIRLDWNDFSWRDEGRSASSRHSRAGGSPYTPAWRIQPKRQRLWIPACAGMTEIVTIAKCRSVLGSVGIHRELMMAAER